MREYKSGMRWAFWRWTKVPSDYIFRLHLLKTPWFAVCLHWIKGPDAEPWLHDHPVTFLSLILRGRYTEKRGVNKDHCYRVWWNFIRANRADRHKIVAVTPGTLTLCFMGPKRQEWGFYTQDGWVWWKNYNREKYG